MFADPLPSFTYNGVALTLPRVSSAGQKSTYRTSDGQFLVTISHQVAGSGLVRSMARLDRFVDVNADLTLEKSGIYVVYERPPTGFSETDMINLATCLFSGLTAVTNAGLKKMNNGES